MKSTTLVAALGFCVLMPLVSSYSYAGGEHRRHPPKQVVEKMAKDMGVSLESKEGRQAVHQALKEQRKAIAASHGFDLDTDSGRKDFKDFRKAQHKEVRAALKALPKEQRKSLKEKTQGMDRNEKVSFLRTELQL